MTRKKPQKTPRHTSIVETSDSTELSVEAASPGTRFVAGMIDFLIVVCCSTLIAALLSINPIFFQIAIFYFLDVGGILTLLLSATGLLGMLFLFFFSFVYFTLEGIFGLSVGKYFFSLRIAGERKWENILLRSFIKSIPPVSLIDFLFVFKKLKYTQRYSDSFLALGIAKLKFESKKSKLFLNAEDTPYIVSGFIMFFLPLIVYVLYNTLFSQLPPAILPPDPESAFPYSPSISFLLQIFINNFYLAYTYYVFGGLLLSFPMTMQVFFQGFTSGMMISGILMSYPSFLLFGIIPHLLFEGLGFAFLIATGLILTETLMDLFSRYRKGKSLSSNRSFLGTQLIRVIKLFLVGVLILFIGSLIEVYITPYILLNFYFY
ncbi:MAG: stage II sporulation protein M [Candidatus Thorarchaeota archaeon]|nr:stage II sporulation protein M [Candidatus Thorarchaeota archaeon]